MSYALPNSFKLFMEAQFWGMVTERLARIVSTDCLCQKIISKEGFTRNVQLRDQPKEVLKFITRTIPKRCEKKSITKSAKKAAVRRSKKVAFTTKAYLIKDLKTLQKFTSPCSGNNLVAKVDNLNGPHFLCVCPYASFIQSFTPTTFNAGNLKEMYKANGWQPVFVDLSVATSTKLQRMYQGVRTVLVFVLDSSFQSGEKFWKVFAPDESCTEVFSLFPGVEIKGKAGYVPERVIGHGFAKNPYVHYRVDKTKLATLTLGFRPFKVCNNVVQWGS